MKITTRAIFAFITILIFSSLAIAQVAEADAKKATESFFAFSKKNDFKGAAKLLAYVGADKSRLYEDNYNPNNPDEFKEVKRICKKINATLLISDSYNFGKFGDRKINGKDIQFLEVEFISGSQKIRRKVFFVKVKEQVAIFDYN
jgi:hypothetical protein